MQNEIFQYTILPDALSQRLYHYRLKAFRIGRILAKAEENPQSYIHLFRVNYILRGKAMLILDDQAFSVCSGHAVIIPPRGILTQADPKAEVEAYFINFDVSNLTLRDEFLTRLQMGFPFYQVHDNDRKILLYFFEQIFNEASQCDLGSCLTVQNLLCSLLIKMVRLAGEGEAVFNVQPTAVNSTHYLISRAVSYIYQHIGDPVSVKAVADNLNISEIYLYKLFKEHTQKSPQTFILEYRMHLACEYLSNPEYSMKTIAQQLGFASADYFSASFHQYAGCSPSAYRQKQIHANLAPSTKVPEPLGQ
ncbi:AraC family transcriptional regulator [Holdemania massiliensis]|uniref:AraC family transcriptional regulator n=1 Tax=Holdemania massiliensis TaxID=1468449 RepID=UPI00242B9BC5|nr:AraC family transcriptional regulator [Holdemania massiliensis]